MGTPTTPPPGTCTLTASHLPACTYLHTAAPPHAPHPLPPPLTPTPIPPAHTFHTHPWDCRRAFCAPHSLPLPAARSATGCLRRPYTLLPSPPFSCALLFSLLGHLHNHMPRVFLRTLCASRGMAACALYAARCGGSFSALQRTGVDGLTGLNMGVHGRTQWRRRRGSNILGAAMRVAIAYHTIVRAAYRQTCATLRTAPAATQRAALSNTGTSLTTRSAASARFAALPLPFATTLYSPPAAAVPACWFHAITTCIRNLHANAYPHTTHTWHLCHTTHCPADAHTAATHACITADAHAR